MIKLHPQAFDFKIRVNVHSYQAWEHRTADSLYTLYLTWSNSKESWEVELEKANNGVVTTLIKKAYIRDACDLSNLLLSSEYPPSKKNKHVIV